MEMTKSDSNFAPNRHKIVISAYRRLQSNITLMLLRNNTVGINRPGLLGVTQLWRSDRPGRIRLREQSG